MRIGTAAMGLGSGGERLSSTANTAWQRETLETRSRRGSVDEGSKRKQPGGGGPGYTPLTGFLLKAGWYDQTSAGGWWG